MSQSPQSSSIIWEGMLSRKEEWFSVSKEQVDGVSFESVLLPPDSFMMGAKEDDPDAAKAKF